MIKIRIWFNGRLIAAILGHDTLHDLCQHEVQGMSHDSRSHQISNNLSRRSEKLHGFLVAVAIDVDHGIQNSGRITEFGVA